MTEDYKNDPLMTKLLKIGRELLELNNSKAYMINEERLDEVLDAVHKIEKLGENSGFEFEFQLKRDELSPDTLIMEAYTKNFGVASVDMNEFRAILKLTDGFDVFGRDDGLCSILFGFPDVYYEV